jgi:hypothetical protein
MARKDLVRPKDLTFAYDRSGAGKEWPFCIQSELAAVDLDTLEILFQFDAVIYLHADTCTDEASLTTTLAHELQHFFQYGSDHRTWAWNGILTNCTNIWNSEGFGWHSIPIEYEARCVAKRVAESLLGEERNAEYIAYRITNAKNELDRTDWEFIKALDPMQPYDVADETKKTLTQFGKKTLYRQEMRIVLSSAKKKLSDHRYLRLDELIGPEELP